MGIVQKQSLNNTLITYLGFGIGAMNILLLYTNFMSDAHYGLVQFILSASAILMPILALGVPNTLVKFYSSFKSIDTQEGFLFGMLVLPLVLVFPIALLAFLANDLIGSFLARENAMVKGYVWHIFLTGMAMAYFEVFYAWARVKMKTIFGNFMKEVFCRIGQTLLLLALYFEWISIGFFVNALVACYLMRTLLMMGYAFSLRKPKLSFDFPTNSRQIITYTFLIILGGSTSIVLLEIDKVMLNQFIKIENVAYYSVAGFMAATIGVPYRAMSQILYPLTAEKLNAGDKAGLRELYHKSSLNLFLVSGFLFVLLVLNLTDIYALLPKPYSGGFLIVLWIGLAKVSDALLGNANSIIFNSDHYKAILFMGVGLALFTVVFNLWLIPVYGLTGAAIASFMAFVIYNVVKLLFIYDKYSLLPFTRDTTKILLLLLGLTAVFYFLALPFHPLVNIGVKSVLMCTIYGFVIYRLKLSEDVVGLISKFLAR